MPANKYLIFDTESDFNVMLSVMNTAFGYPNACATTYTLPVLDSNSPKAAMLIEQRCLEHLTQEQQDALVTSLPEGWDIKLPVIEEPTDVILEEINP